MPSVWDRIEFLVGRARWVVNALEYVGYACQSLSSHVADLCVGQGREGAGLETLDRV